VSTRSYVSYEPTPALWTNYYSLPQESLYYYDVPTNSYIVEEEPSPYSEYYTYDVPTGTYFSYVPEEYAPEVPEQDCHVPEEHSPEVAEWNSYVPEEHSPEVPEWTRYYEESLVSLYSYVPETEQFEEVSTPSVYETYYYQSYTY
jgi:hypothetical protein